MRVGDRPPALSLPALDGATTRLEDLRGQVVVVDFWASWCGLCHDALPALDAIARRHAGEGLRVLAVNLDHTRSAADAFLDRRLPDRTVTVLLDPDGTSLGRFGADGMPTLYVIDRDGVVRLVESGYAPAGLPDVERTIVDLLASHPPPPGG